MSGQVWLCIPSARPAAEANVVLAKWRGQGYKIALWRDTTVGVCTLVADDVNIAPYPGYARASNFLAHHIFATEPDCDWVVFGGDDVEPDLNHTADEIAHECSQHFGGTFGAVQPTGDRWGSKDIGPWPRGSAYIDRVAGSPWIGREFARRAYAGNGPLWPEYFHMQEDAELQAVATKLGCFWQRPDLIHLHNHWQKKPNAGVADCPEHLKFVSGQKHWAEAKALFERRQAQGFPGHEVLP